MKYTWLRHRLVVLCTRKNNSDVITYAHRVRQTHVCSDRRPGAGVRASSSKGPHARRVRTFDIFRRRRVRLYMWCDNGTHEPSRKGLYSILYKYTGIYVLTWSVYLYTCITIAHHTHLYHQFNHTCAHTHTYTHTMVSSSLLRRNGSTAGRGGYTRYYNALGDPKRMYDLYSFRDHRVTHAYGYDDISCMYKHIMCTLETYAQVCLCVCVFCE